MTHPHPCDAGFADAYSRAWTSDPVDLLDFFDPDGTYTDVPMRATYTGREEIARFHRWMLKFAPDSVITFSDACAASDEPLARRASGDEPLARRASGDEPLARRASGDEPLARRASGNGRLYLQWIWSGTFGG